MSFVTPVLLPALLINTRKRTGNLINSLDKSFLLRDKNRSPDTPVQVG